MTQRNPSYHVLCTRKLEDKWAEQALCHHIVLHSFDFLHLAPKAPANIKACLESNLFPLVFTSQHAVRALAALDKEIPGVLKTKACFCTVGTTRELLEQEGFPVLGAAINASQLAGVIAQHGCQAVLHCTTKDHRAELYQILAASGITVKSCEVYEKNKIPRKAGQFDGILFFSPSQVDSFLQINVLDETIPAFCIGLTTAQHLAKLGHQLIFTPAQASIQSALHSVYEYFRHLP